MIVSEDKKFIFIHVPKTAGNSIESALPKCNRSHIGRKHFLLSEIDKKDLFAFGFTRNPWDRMVSLYTFRCNKDNQNNKFNQEKLKETGFEKSLLSGLLGKDNPPWDGIPALKMTNDSMTWLSGCDYIGRFEKLQEDFDIICDAIQIVRKKLPHTNKSNHGDYRNYYTPEMVEYVAENHKRTIERFGYSFE